MFSWFRSLRGKNSNAELSERMLTLQRIIDVRIDDPSLFEKALRHRSTLSNDEYEKHDSYERLEFLGDAVLDLIAAEILFELYPTKNEGFLTKLRAKLVRGETLTKFSRQLGFDQLMEMGERSSTAAISKSILADAFEAIIAAIYITRGYQEAYKFVESVFKRFVDFDDFVNTTDNFKSALLEYAQGKKLPLPRYVLIDEYGPGHNRTFYVKVILGDEERGGGKGKSKKKAEQEAARQALESLGVNNN